MISNETRDSTNFHTIHCDQRGCAKSYTLHHRYFQLDRLRAHAEIDGWMFAPDPDSISGRVGDWCPGHSPVVIPRAEDLYGVEISATDRLHARARRLRQERQQDRADA